MEFPKIRVIDGSEDCINVVFEGFEKHEVEAILRRLGWIDVYASHEATLEGETPILELEYPVLLEFVHYHIRLFKYGGKIVGNVHFNNVDVKRLKRLGLHASDHEKGVSFLKMQLEKIACTSVVEGKECLLLMVAKCL
jgi:hypothetical protein